MKHLRLLALLLAGCAATPPRVEYVQVPVPVACTALAMPDKSRLALEDLPLRATDKRRLPFYAESLRACRTNSKKLEILLKVPSK